MTAQRREIVSHRTNRVNERLRVEALDEPGPGGACCLYAVSWEGDGEAEGDARETGAVVLTFHAGADDRPNGVTNEALLAVVMDRLEGFESGRQASHEGTVAKGLVRRALEILRTAEQRRRAAAGTDQP